ncbi:MAG TPA: DUF2231 domain-containing protein [Candidatus Dadabacteria bacterium]|jgi:uncharacterized membrane protein|nr:DUF2231 domain-containing protein [Candidatus Dadabacteria bacterium]
MVEIIPNFHPIFVHFSIGLLGISPILFLIGYFLKKKTWSEVIYRTAHINLIVGTIISIFTVITGLNAYDTVAHDTQSHIAMTDHRNLGLLNISLWIFMSIWSFRLLKKSLTVTPIFLIFIIISSVTLFVTGYHGSEVVYRHGIGVMRLPDDSRFNVLDKEIQNLKESDKNHIKRDNEHSDGHDHKH